MNYANGEAVKVGDIVGLDQDKPGVVVCSISDGVYTQSHPEAAWAYLKHGFIVDFPKYGLIHFDQAKADLKLIARAKASD